MQQTMRFDLANGFPVITDRSIAAFWRKPIGELCAFINGATTLEELRDVRLRLVGRLGDARRRAAGAASRRRHRARLVRRRVPRLPRPATGRRSTSSRTWSSSWSELPARPHPLRVSPWIPQYQRPRAEGRVPQTTIAPCHGWVHVRVLNDRLHLHMFQRSGDVPIGVPSNMVQYAALVLMLEQLTGFEAGDYYHTISDAHIYENQVEKVRVLLEREPKPLGYLRLTDEGRSVTDIHDFRAEHFELSDYDPNPGLRIPVAV